MISAGPDPLLERGAELEGLAAQPAAARAAAGSVALLEAPAGQGKTALLRVLRGTADGLRVLSATGAPLERDFAFGIVRQLFEAELRRADAERRARLLAGAAALAEPVFGLEASGDGHATLYGLYWLCANLAAEQPLLVIVDDAHWADAPSLRFLDALARRVEDLPVLLAIAARPAEPAAEQALLDGLATAPATTLLRPAPLSAEGVSSLVRARMEAPEPAFVQACFETTAGNPLLLTELLRAAPFAGRADEADAVRTTVPGTVARTVTARIRRLSPGALAVARATAVLGDATSVSRVAALSDVAEAEAELEVLARADLIEDGRFVHPMIAEVVDADLGVERARLHRRAARLLAADGALDGVVATHLLAAGPESDPWAAGVLAAAGRRALAEGAPDVALRCCSTPRPRTRDLALARAGAVPHGPRPAADARRGGGPRNARDRGRSRPAGGDRAPPAQRAAGGGRAAARGARRRHAERARHAGQGHAARRAATPASPAGRSRSARGPRHPGRAAPRSAGEARAARPGWRGPRARARRPTERARATGARRLVRGAHRRAAGGARRGARGAARRGAGLQRRRRGRVSAAGRARRGQRAARAAVPSRPCPRARGRAA